MKTPVEILLAVNHEGGRLEPAGDKLRVLLPADCAPELKDAIRQHKYELLDLLDARAANLPPDCVPWLHIARQVLAGEFDGADKSTVESLTIGLRSISIPLCQQALNRLPHNKEKRTNWP
jgi:hypothetical protein